MKLSDKEWRVLNALWVAPEGLALGAVVDALRPDTGWSRSTVLTYLTRMEAKGLVDIRKEDFPHRYRAAVSREELGNPVYPPARRVLAAHGIRCEGHAARQMTAQDYEKYDLLIGMDRSNITRMCRICGGDPDGKMSRLLDHTCRPGDVADPWYTGEFEATWRDIEEGCRALLDELG